MSEFGANDSNHLFLGRYHVGEQVHAGGMARVYRSQDLESDALVALKRPVKEDASAIARFLDEGKILSELKHPAIVRLISHGGTTLADAHIAMEWLDGETLSERLRSGPISLRDAVAVVLRVAEALSIVHRAQIVHRDLKPENVILCDGSPTRATLIDFGIARRQTERSKAVHSSFAGGTWAYMSPEQAMGSAESGPRTDIYSLGCVLFEAITGSPLFPSDRAQAVLKKVWHPAPLLADFCVDVPGPLSALLAKMLSTDPLQRQRDGGMLATELLALGKLPDRVATLKD